LTIYAKACYQVTLFGSLDENWSNCAGMSVRGSRDGDNRPITRLTGEVVDQGMLLGVLNHVYDMGMPILRVEWMGLDAGEQSGEQNRAVDRGAL
jgi:hypothetical protein